MRWLNLFGHDNHYLDRSVFQHQSPLNFVRPIFQVTGAYRVTLSRQGEFSMHRSSAKSAAPLVLLLTVMAWSFASLAHAAEKPVDPAQKQLQNCLDDAANASTSGQTECIGNTQEIWDQRMNRAYSRLMRELPASAAASLRTAQLSWLAYRDTELKAQNDLYETRQGTMYVPMEANDAMLLTLNRAKLLEGYVGVLEIDKP